MIKGLIAGLELEYLLPYGIFHPYNSNISPFFILARKFISLLIYDPFGIGNR